MKNSTSPGARGALRTATGKRAVAVGVATVAAVGALAAGVGLPTAAPTAPPTDVPAPLVQPPGLAEFRSPQFGFALAYPSDWTRVTSPDPEVPLEAGRGPHAFRVRVTDLPPELASQDLAAAKKMTDGIVLSDQSVKLRAEPQQISLAGLPGYFYLYNFADPTTGATGAHSHLFVFKGNKMIVIVFEALPAEQFTTGSATFDQITSSFRVE